MTVAIFDEYCDRRADNLEFDKPVFHHGSSFGVVYKVSWTLTIISDEIPPLASWVKLLSPCDERVAKSSKDVKL